MKKLIFILIGCFCFGQNADSLKLVEQLKRLDDLNNETMKLIKKAEKVEHEKENLIFKLKAYFINFKKNDETIKKRELKFLIINQEAVKVENETEPTSDHRIKFGSDTIRYSWLYRQFNRKKYYLRNYTIINNEKIYLD